MEAKNLIEYAILNGKINKSALCEMANQMPDDVCQRFVEAILGIVNLDYVANGIPETKKEMFGQKDCRLVGFNYLFQRVSYEYDNEETRYFEDEKMAEEFTKDGSNRWRGLRNPVSGSEFSGTHTFTETSDCRLEQWMSED